ncbi:MAG: DUF1573 domain-containing protein [bacterium]|nr:DUF1573 domain-containing protein [bacterium]
MDKKTLIISVLVLFGIAGLIWWGGSDSQATATSQNFGAISSLSAQEKLYDFGTISMKNGLVDHVFKIVNSSDKDVFVKKITTSCMCTGAYIEGAGGKKGPFKMEGMGFVPLANETIKAGESRDLRVVYDPNAHGPAGVGTIDRLIYLADASGGVIQFEIKAVVTP